MAKAKAKKSKTSKAKTEHTKVKSAPGTKEQMSVPAAFATQLDPKDYPDKYIPDDTELVMDPDTRGWVQYGQIKDAKEKAKKAEEESVAGGQKQAAKEKETNKDSRTNYGEPEPEEVSAGRERGEDAQKLTEENRTDAIAESEKEAKDK